MSIQVVLSPSKLLNEQAISPDNCQLSQPPFLNECKRLAKELLKYDVGEWQKKLAVKQEVAQRSIDWTTQIVKSNFKNIRIPAACLFQGEAYKFLEASSFSKKNGSMRLIIYSFFQECMGFCMRLMLFCPID